jgi:hypothetical protein
MAINHLAVAFTIRRHSIRTVVVAKVVEEGLPDDVMVILVHELLEMMLHEPFGLFDRHGLLKCSG